MKVSICVFSVFTCLLASTLYADVVELKNGKRIDGLILSENDDSLEVQVGQNETGTIRQVLIIHSSEISSWVADKEGRAVREKGQDVHRLGGTEYVERLLRDAESEIEAGNYDQGILQFGEAADLATDKVGQLEPEERVKALKMRAHALRLQLAALEGKSEALEKKTEGVQDEMEEREKLLKKDIDQFKKDKDQNEEDVKTRSIQLGERYLQNDLVKREEELTRRQFILKEQKSKVDFALGEYEKDLVKTQTQIKLVEERVDQAEDDAKEAEKALRRR